MRFYTSYFNRPKSVRHIAQYKIIIHSSISRKIFLVSLSPRSVLLRYFLALPVFVLHINLFECIILLFVSQFSATHLNVVVSLTFARFDLIRILFSFFFHLSPQQNLTILFPSCRINCHYFTRDMPKASLTNSN